MSSKHLTWLFCLSVMLCTSLHARLLKQVVIYNECTQKEYPFTIEGIVFQDGYTWLISSSGLNRLDKTTLKIDKTIEFDSSKQPGGRFNPVLFGLNEDIWFGVKNGIVRYNRGEWTAYYPDNPDLQDLVIVSMAIDKQNRLWLDSYVDSEEDFTYSPGLIEFDEGQWIVHKIPCSRSGELGVNSLIVDDENVVWLGTSYHPWMVDDGLGLCSFDGSVWSIYGSGDAPTQVLSMGIDSKKRIWIGFANETEGGCFGSGLSMYDGMSWVRYSASNSDLPYERVYDLWIDGSDRIWMIAEGDELSEDNSGLISFDGSQWKEYLFDNLGLSISRGMAFNFDANGRLWIGDENYLFVIDVD